MASSGVGPGGNANTREESIVEALSMFPPVFADDRTGEIYGELLRSIEAWQRKNSKNANRMNDEKAFRYTKNEIIEKLAAKIREQIRATAALSAADAKVQTPVYLRKIIYTWGFEELGNDDLSCNYAYVCEQRSWGESTLKQILEKAIQALSTIYDLGFQEDLDEELAHHILTEMMPKLSRQLCNQVFRDNMIRGDRFKDNQRGIFVDTRDGNSVVGDQYRTTGKDKIYEIRRLVRSILQPQTNSLKVLLSNWNIKNKYIRIKHQGDGTVCKETERTHDCLSFLTYEEKDRSVNFDFLVDIFNRYPNSLMDSPDFTSNPVPTSVLPGNANAFAVVAPSSPGSSAAVDVKAASTVSAMASAAAMIAPAANQSLLPANDAKLIVNTKAAFFCSSQVAAGPQSDAEYAEIFLDDPRGVVCRCFLNKLDFWAQMAGRYHQNCLTDISRCVKAIKQKIASCKNNEVQRKLGRYVGPQETLRDVISNWYDSDVYAKLFKKLNSACNSDFILWVNNPILNNQEFLPLVSKSPQRQGR